MQYAFLLCRETILSIIKRRKFREISESELKKLLNMPAPDNTVVRSSTKKTGDLLFGKGLFNTSVTSSKSRKISYETLAYIHEFGLRCCLMDLIGVGILSMVNTPTGTIIRMKASQK
jgi:hypothetical protein